MIVLLKSFKQGGECMTAPGGHPSVEKCSGGVKFCKYQMLNEKKNMMGCADACKFLYSHFLLHLFVDEQKLHINLEHFPKETGCNLYAGP